MHLPSKNPKSKRTPIIPGAKLKRDKARNALRDSRIGLEIVVLQIAKLLDEFAMAKTDIERAEILNRSISYLSKSTMGSLNLAQLASCQCELLLLHQLTLK